MSFTLIVGPMKSGKSLELIARVAPYEFAKQKVIYVQPEANVRDSGISSRLGINTTAWGVKSLREVKDVFDVIGIDEVHMFPEDDVRVIERWIEEKRDVFISGLDLDYRALMPPIVKRLHELRPDLVISKLAVCDSCHQYTAAFTQVLHRGEPVLGGLPSVLPEDGTYQYEARCRDCFFKHP